ncbi:MAG: methylated-DNA--[protein]-cysteine S-methyltransferase, partial [Pseudomonadota bacterium]|nr:methylated-DNA--[protein]-cysteine S-methyltransferase [Pseudomonadota bacterium]
KLRPLATQILNQPHKVPVSLRGTDFQKKVWRRLMEIPTGTTTTYGKISDNLQSAPRAVGTAVGKNPISLLVPCHRIIGSKGQLHGYRWGLDIKKSLLAAEGAPVSVAF